MTSSSASGSTWRILYGSIGVSHRSPRHAAAVAHRRAGVEPSACERARRIVRAEPPEQVADDVAAGRRDGQGQDRPEQPGERAADDDREHDARRVELDRVALDLGHEEVVLDLLDEDVQDERGDDRLEARRSPPAGRPGPPR